MEAAVVVVSAEKDAVDTKVVGTVEGSAGEAVIMAMEVGVGRTGVRVGVRIGGISSSPPSRDVFVCLLVCESSCLCHRSHRGCRAICIGQFDQFCVCVICV
jgi:hypothetical protein